MAKVAVISRESLKSHVKNVLPQWPEGTRKDIYNGTRLIYSNVNTILKSGLCLFSISSPQEIVTRDVIEAIPRRHQCMNYSSTVTKLRADEISITSKVKKGGRDGMFACGE